MITYLNSSNIEIHYKLTTNTMSNFSEPIKRRNFIKAASASLLLTSISSYGFEFFENEKPKKVGLIGTGWYGTSDLMRLIQVANVEVVSLCDVDTNFLNETAILVSKRQKNGKKPKLFSDYREMLKNDNLDIVLIGTPDHWHALTCIAALKSGAHVYVQKPISIDVIEGEAMVAAARKYNRTVQVGTQRKSTPHLIDVKKQIIDTGLLGTIGHVDMACYYHMRANGNPPLQEVPDFLDYEMWTGPAPFRPYDGIPHRRWWRTFREYGNGITGDMCGANGVLKGDVMKAEFIPLDGGEPIRFDVLYEREKYPEDLTEKDIELHAAPATRGHMIDFLNAIENGTKPIADIEEGHISTASCILANLSMDLKRPLVYDPKSRTVLNDPEATALLQRSYRGNWEHPHPDTV